MNLNIIDKLPVKKQLTAILYITMGRSKQKMRTRRISNGKLKELTNTTTSHSCLVSSSKSIGLHSELSLRMTCRVILTILKVAR